jgi:hypothetical protein
MSKISLTDITGGYIALDVYNTNNQTLEDAIDNTLSRDGSGPNMMEAQLDMNSNRIVNLLDAVNLSEPVTLRQATQLAGVAVPLTKANVGGALWPTSDIETAHSVTPSDLSYEYSDIRRYGASPDGSTDSTAAFEKAALLDRCPIWFGRETSWSTSVLSDYSKFYILRDAQVNGMDVMGPANIASDGTQDYSMLSLGREPDSSNGQQWRWRQVYGLNFSGKLRADTAIRFGENGTSHGYPSALSTSWEITNCYFERCEKGIEKPHGNFGQVIRNTSASSCNFGYHARGYPIASELSAAEALGQTVLSVTDTNFVSVDDVVRVLMDDGTTHKSTVTAVTATTVTILDAIDDSAAAGNWIKFYHPDDAVPVTLSHIGADWIIGGEWGGCRKAAFYIDAQNAQGSGGTVLQSVIIENNPGFGIFVKDYNNAYTPMHLKNCWFESNGKDAAGYTGTVDLGDGQGAREPKDIYLENVDSIVIEGSQIRLIEIIDSSVHFDHCTFESGQFEATITNTNNLNNIRVTNLHIAAWGEGITGAKDIVVESVARVDRELGSSVCRMWRIPQQTPISINEPLKGTVIESNRGDTGEDWQGVSVADVARDGYVEGATYPNAVQYTFLAGNTYIAPATSAAVGLNQNKWYVMTMELKVDSGLANLDTLRWGSGYNITRGDAESLCTEGEWVTIGVVGLLDANHQAGSIRPMVTCGVGGNTQITWGATQIVEFDEAQDAYDFHNKHVHVWQYKDNGFRVRRADSAARATTTTTLTDDELTDIPLQEDTWYSVKGVLLVDTDATADFAAALNFSQVEQLVNVDFKFQDAATVVYGEDTGSGTGSLAGTANIQRLWFEGVFHSNATTGGTVDIGWGQGTSNAYSTLIKQGSWMKVSKLHDEN